MKLKLIEDTSSNQFLEDIMKSLLQEQWQVLKKIRLMQRCKRQVLDSTLKTWWLPTIFVTLDIWLLVHLKRELLDWQMLESYQWTLALIKSCFNHSVYLLIQIKFKVFNLQQVFNLTSLLQQRKMRNIKKFHI